MATPVQKKPETLPVVALVGRVNVGKSTFFNKLIEKQKAIVSNIPGTTRTRNEGTVLWRGKEFKLIDTGGLTFSDDVILEDDIIDQTKKALDEADIVVFVTDGEVGILPQERELVKLLRKTKLPVLLVANKIDSAKIEQRIDLHEWATLGLGTPFLISAASGYNVGDFLDLLFKQMHTMPTRPKQTKEEQGDRINISLIGKPNVGKSSLFNKIIGEDRVIVSDMAHTTREPYDTDVVYEHTVGDETVQQHITFLDTAGIRRKAKVAGFLERMGIRKSIDAIDESDLVLFVLDGADPISSQDRQLGGLLERRSKSVIILINKWDLTDDNSESRQIEVKKMVYGHFPHLSFAPIMFVSGKTGLHVHKIFPLIMQIWQARHTTIGVKALEAFLREATSKKLPSRGKGTRHPKLLGIRQLNANPPIFELAVKYRTSLHRSYVNYLENRLREQFDFLGTPIVIKLRKTRRGTS